MVKEAVGEGLGRCSWWVGLEGLSLLCPSQGSR